MKIDEYIAAMQKLRQNHGAELEVLQSRFEEGVINSRVTRKAPLPRIAHKQIAPSRSLFREGQDPDRLRGVKVVVL